jgi:hypothetical protein
MAVGATRKYPNIPAITQDLQNHSAALQAVKEALEIGQRRTADIPSSFIRVSDLVELGLISIFNGRFVLNPEVISSNSGGSGSSLNNYFPAGWS